MAGCRRDSAGVDVCGVVADRSGARGAVASGLDSDLDGPGVGRVCAALATLVTIAAAVGVARWGGALGPTLYFAVPALVWLVVDQGVRASRTS